MSVGPFRVPRIVLGMGVSLLVRGKQLGRIAYHGFYITAIYPMGYLCAILATIAHVATQIIFFSAPQQTI